METIGERLGRSKEAIYKSLQRIRRALSDCVDRKLRSEGDAVMTVGRKPLDVLLAAVCHGTADQSQMQQLADLLRHDMQAMDEYLRQVDLHVLLATDPALGLASSGGNRTDSERQAKSLVRRRRRCGAGS